MRAIKNGNRKLSGLVTAAIFVLTPVQAALAGSTTGSNTDNNHGVQDSTDIGANIANTKSFTGTPKTDCPATYESWSVSSYTCGGQASSCPFPGAENCAVPANTDVIVDDKSGAGDAQYHCDGSNGVLSLNPGTASCAAMPSCAAAAVSWSANGNTCSGTSGAGAAESSITVSNSNSGYSGSAGYTCQLASPSATAPSWIADPSAAPATCLKGCAAGTMTWTVGTSTCTADTSTPVAVNGATPPSVSDTGAPSTGSAIFSCSNGMWITSSSTCTAPATPATPPPITVNSCTVSPPATPPPRIPPPPRSTPGPCSSQTIYWKDPFDTGNGAVCKGTSSSSAESVGSEVYIGTIPGSPGAGAGYFVCQANGQWKLTNSNGGAPTDIGGGSYSPYCSLPCPAQTGCWKDTSDPGNGAICKGNLASSSSTGGWASEFIGTSSGSPGAGAGYFLCQTNGQWKLTTSDGTSTGYSPYCSLPCPAKSVSWNDASNPGNGAVCNGNLSATGAGNAEFIGTSPGSPGAGQGYFTCQDTGQWQLTTDYQYPITCSP